MPWPLAINALDGHAPKVQAIATHFVPFQQDDICAHLYWLPAATDRPPDPATDHQDTRSSILAYDQVSFRIHGGILMTIGIDASDTQAYDWANDKWLPKHERRLGRFAPIKHAAQPDADPDV